MQQIHPKFWHLRFFKKCFFFQILKKNLKKNILLCVSVLFSSGNYRSSEHFFKPWIHLNALTFEAHAMPAVYCPPPPSPALALQQQMRRTTTTTRASTSNNNNKLIILQQQQCLHAFVYMYNYLLLLNCKPTNQPGGGGGGAPRVVMQQRCSGTAVSSSNLNSSIEECLCLSLCVRVSVSQSVRASVVANRCTSTP